MQPNATDLDRAKAQLTDAWRAMYDATTDAKEDHHVNVNVYIFKKGLDCSQCSQWWDGFWEHDDTLLCRECGDAILQEVMG